MEPHIAPAPVSPGPALSTGCSTGPEQAGVGIVCGVYPRVGAVCDSLARVDTKCTAAAAQR